MIKKFGVAASLLLVLACADASAFAKTDANTFVGGTRAKARARSHKAANKRISRATAKRLAALAHARGKHQKGLRELQGGWTFENSAYRREDFSRLRGQMPWPVDCHEVSMRFGYQKYGDQSIYCNNHGITIDCEAGADVKSVCAGEVVAVFEIGDVDAVVIKHGHFYVTYSNLDSIALTKGDAVVAGQVLGQIGEIGQLEFLISEQSDHFLDPEKWLRRD